VQVLQEFSDLPVQIFTTSEVEDARTQIRKFHGFDVLVSPHGGQLANIMFADIPVSVIEVVPVPSSFEFINSAARMGFGPYFISDGHAPISFPSNPECNMDSSTLNREFAQCSRSSESLYMTCPEGLGLTFRNCHIMVNTTLLQEDFTRMLNLRFNSDT
jgi:prepilin-type processing-associated H-X9-DG protein